LNETVNETAPKCDTADDTAGDSAARRPDLRRLSRFVLRRAADKKLTQVAASLTFTTVLGTVPLLAVVLALFTAFPLFAEFQTALEEFLTANLMPPAVSTHVMGYLNLFASKASGLTAVGSLALVVTSIMLIRTIDDALNNLWQVREQRPLRQRLLVYWAILSLGPVLMGASLWASSVMAQQSLSLVEQLPTSLGLLLSAVPLVLTGLGFTGLFMLVPNCRVHWKDALAGGLVTALVLAVMRWGFGFYLSRFPSYTIIYGAFATLPIFLLWVYLSWLAVLSGAAIAATLPAIRERHWEHRHYPGTTLVDALAVLKALWPTVQEPMNARRAGDLAIELDMSPDALEALLQRLRALELIVNTQIEGSEHWLLAADPRTVRLGPLMEALLLDTEQPGLDPKLYLPHALARVLLGQDVRLATLFEDPVALSEIDGLVQNRLSEDPIGSP